jgi:hypothetical protein
MSRRADPARIFQACRDAIRNTLTGSGMSLEIANRWCGAWELNAVAAGCRATVTTGRSGPMDRRVRAARRPGW